MATDILDFGSGKAKRLSFFQDANTLLSGLSLAFATYIALASMITGPVGLLLSLTMISDTLGTLHYRHYRKALLLNLMAATHSWIRLKGKEEMKKV